MLGLKGLVFRVQGLKGLGCRIQGLGFEGIGVERFRVFASEFGFWGRLGLRVQDSGFRVHGLGFRVKSLGFLGVGFGGVLGSQTEKKPGHLSSIPKGLPSVHASGFCDRLNVRTEAETLNP